MSFCLKNIFKAPIEKAACAGEEVLTTTLQRVDQINHDIFFANDVVIRTPTRNTQQDNPSWSVQNVSSSEQCPMKGENFQQTSGLSLVLYGMLYLLV